MNKCAVPEHVSIQLCKHFCIRDRPSTIDVNRFPRASSSATLYWLRTITTGVLSTSHKPGAPLVGQC